MHPSHHVKCHDCRDRQASAQEQTEAAKPRKVCQDLSICQIIILKYRLACLVSHCSVGSNVISTSDLCGMVIKISLNLA